MHPFGGTPICPRCTKVVYAAEQIIGPGRKLYHKACLKCTSCNKRLDPYSLLEHDEQPYCKTCHMKLFGTRDLRHANLPHRDDTLSSPPRAGPARADSPPALPARPSSTTTPRALGDGMAQPQPVRRHHTGSTAGAENGKANPSPPGLLRPTRTLSPSKGLGIAAAGALTALDDVPEDAAAAVRWDDEDEETSAADVENAPSSPNGNGSAPSTPNAWGRFAAVAPLTSSLTGTRYGAALGGPLVANVTGRQWGAGAGGTPKCARCSRAVYFAEQVKAIGKTWHKACLRCTECGHTLDTGRVVDREGEPFCARCYGKKFGPQGSGYALLGKAGG